MEAAVFLSGFILQRDEEKGKHFWPEMTESKEQDRGNMRREMERRGRYTAVDGGSN